MDPLEQNIFPSIGKRPIADISAKDTLDVLTGQAGRCPGDRFPGQVAM
jgi:hypothetical protein